MAVTPIARPATVTAIGDKPEEAPPRHGRACPGHPDSLRRGAFLDRDHRHGAGDDGERTRPVDHGGGRACQPVDNVPVLFLTIVLTVAISLPRSVPTRGALEAFAVLGTGTVPQ
jgi:hypothetical protein